MKIEQINKKSKRGKIETVTKAQVSTAKKTPVQTATVSIAPKSSPKTVRLTHEQIAERAKAIWMSRGCVPGHDEQNWLDAEAQLRSELVGAR